MRLWKDCGNSSQSTSVAASRQCCAGRANVRWQEETWNLQVSGRDSLEIQI